MKKRGFFMMIFFGMGSFFSGCGFHQNDVDLSVEEFERRINQDKVQLVDVRTPEEYASEHIPNAISINILSEEFDSLSTQILNPEYPVFVYCRSGKRSAMAAKRLLAKNYVVYQLKGGIIAWKKSRKPIE